MAQKTYIQLKLLAVGIQQNQIAESLCLTPQTVYRVLSGKSHNQVVQEYIAKLLGHSPKKLWGASYAPLYRKNKKNTTDDIVTSSCPKKNKKI